MDELAKRAVACEGWRWLTGMSLYGRGAVVVIGQDQTDGPDGLVVLSKRHGLTDFIEAEPDWLPDLRDACTLGGLLALVREAWGPYRLDIHVMPSGHTDITCGPLRPSMQLRRASEAKALVAALEAAPAHAANSSVTTTGNETS